jgi:hypothetical protein
MVELVLATKEDLMVKCMPLAVKFPSLLKRDELPRKP